MFKTTSINSNPLFMVYSPKGEPKRKITNFEEARQFLIKEDERPCKKRCTLQLQYDIHAGNRIASTTVKQIIIGGNYIWVATENSIYEIEM